MYIKNGINLEAFFYSRGSKHYARFFVPTHLQATLGKRFLVFALGSGAGHEIRLKAHQIEHYLTTQLLQNNGMNFPYSKLDLLFSNGTQLKNINNDDLRRAKELLKALGMHASAGSQAPAPVQALQAPEPAQVKGLKLIELVDKFFCLNHS